MQVLVDTNFLMYNPDIGMLAEYGEVFTLSSCVRELEKISRAKGKHRKKAAVALLIIKNLKTARTEKKGDAAIIDYARKHRDTIIATNDSELIKTLKNNGIRVIRLRQRKYVVEE